MLSSANTVQPSVSAVTSLPAPNLRATTSSRPASPSSSPSHCLGVTLPCPAAPPDAPTQDSHSAVSTGCKPTISAASPAPMPPLTATQTPPR